MLQEQLILKCIQFNHQGISFQEKTLNPNICYVQMQQVLNDLNELTKITEHKDNINPAADVYKTLKAIFKIILQFF
ncbi:hypothetical protein TTHERM_000096767 (macronuclear) [Tetrahymena thermophila SB210]|uniref:Uncharacterized protein n=1 Tax=Tetrahymena thermophila (strain SB210) TaxID=312017 RepID=W7XD18_TETTS|nr:hypothetical protein TTHERM_000096767 [Tetrahymena thermophila SB210]EWS75377.1 hypothetical protein TTHERM_000096767 [Tetrahymena thermophila SB210]|eukprot:XP_012652051.1 hypothetical protein TTHERM_000096767 [Tetrahymena thermophila SB210]